MEGVNVVDTVALITAFLAIFVGPIGGYLTQRLAKKKDQPELRIIDIETINNWAQERREWEKEVKELHEELLRERDLRRADREQYYIELDKLKMEIENLKTRLADCLKT